MFLNGLWYHIDYVWTQHQRFRIYHSKFLYSNSRFTLNSLYEDKILLHWATNYMYTETTHQSQPEHSSLLTCLEKTEISSLKLSELHTSPPDTPESRGVQVASSHFSKMSASRGNRGCLGEEGRRVVRGWAGGYVLDIFKNIRAHNIKV